MLLKGGTRGIASKESGWPAAPHAAAAAASRCSTHLPPLPLTYFASIIE